LFSPLSGIMRIVPLVWACCFLLFPFTNRRRLRIGDLLAGTMVVALPRTRLLPDMGRRSAAAPARHAFTDAQLDVYGERELRVLEQVVRRAGDVDVQREAVVLVAARIGKKIGMATPTEPKAAARFLREYYAALRARLERRLVLGRRKLDKHSK